MQTEQLMNTWIWMNNENSEWMIEWRMQICVSYPELYDKIVWMWHHINEWLVHACKPMDNKSKYYLLNSKQIPRNSGKNLCFTKSKSDHRCTKYLYNICVFFSKTILTMEILECAKHSHMKANYTGKISLLL